MSGINLRDNAKDTKKWPFIVAFFVVEPLAIGERCLEYLWQLPVWKQALLAIAPFLTMGALTGILWLMAKFTFAILNASALWLACMLAMAILKGVRQSLKKN